ncbi:MaoC family dehydratase [soil metagenome]
MTAERVPVGGPWFEDLHVGQVFDDAPALTLTTGHTALHAALFGDRLRMALDCELSAVVTGRSEPLVHPNLVCNVAIGQTTTLTQRVLANLFYRGLVLLQPVFVGDTLRTTTEVAGLKQNTARPGKPASGLVALAIRVENQRGEVVLDFWRCPMLPLRDQDVVTGHADSFDFIEAELDPAALEAAVPAAWRLDDYRSRVPSPPAPVVPSSYEVEGRDTVTSAPELARATLNLAAVHTDAGASTFGRRLVYGGHTISLAGAHVTRAFPDLVTIIGWRSCEHTGPVFEGDVLRTTVVVEGLRSLATGARLVDLRARVHRMDEDVLVLDWHLVGVLP